ncbi:hypothetical protein [Tannerella forsythia]|uniref:hypothetical protein n=1 Tax=Tannerella forsythia TaxID=28112 RepID=UPI0012D8CBAD|nr:hypothetical protein [Tannerella forsythia]
MKRKVTSSVSKLMLAAFLLAASSGGIAWGQAYISGPAGVQNTFGAGESARLNNGTVIFPGGGTWTGSEIEIATGSGNIVINSYNAGGRYTDYTNKWTGNWSGSGNGRCNSPWPDWTGGVTWNGPTAQTTPDYTDPCNSSDTHSHPSIGTSNPYTSNQEGATDDGVALVQTDGSQIIDDGTYNSRGNAKTSGGGLTDYQRPTTIAIEGNTTIDKITIGDLRWYYKTIEVTTQQVEALTGCRLSQNCSDQWHSGHPGHYTWDASATYHKHQHKSHSWDRVQTHIGNTFLDAGVLILNGAEVCVNHNISDNTNNGNGAQSSFTTSSTEGVLIWPESGRFTLRVGENFGKISLAHKDNPGNSDHGNPYFTQSQFNNLPVQNKTNGNMYLDKGSGTEYSFLNTANLPLSYYTNIHALYDKTPVSLLGIKGNYDEDNAIIHTSSTGTDNHKGVIEVGSRTTGQQRFKVYSGGVIKNYSTTACNGEACAGVFFKSGNVPEFIIKGTEPLYILNDGNCCEAAITFFNGGTAALVSAVQGADATGDLLIRAHGEVRIQDNADFDATAKNNNVSILSDQSHISTKAFGYTAAGASDLGHLTLWAKGDTFIINTPNNCGGYVSIEGNLTTTSTSTGSTWQTLTDAVQRNSGKLARRTNCSSFGEEMAARAPSALETGVQTRIQSDRDYVKVTGDFKHIGQNGGLFVQGAGKVTVNGKTEIDFKTKDGIGDAVIQSKNSSVWFNNEFSYTGNVTTDLFIDGEKGVTFNSASGPSTIDYTQGTDPSAHIGIQSNAGTIAFKNKAFTFKSKSTGETQLWAGANITSTDNAPLLFEYTVRNDGQNIDWYAGRDIDLSGTLTFKHDDAKDHTGFIKLRANANEAELWNHNSTDPTGRPGAGICPEICDHSDNGIHGNIYLRNDVKVNYWGKENVWMAANHDIHIQRNYTHVAGGAGQDPQGFTRFVAGNDIVTGKIGDPNSTFSYLHVGEKGERIRHFDMKAGHDIITYNHVKIGYNAATDDAFNTTLFACNDIDIRNSFWYADSSTTNKGKWTRLYANRDILSNQTCLNYGAPINFYTPDNTKTEWNAGRNIITGDTVNFRYGNTQKKVSNLSLVAQGGNIEMRRWTNINYDSDSLILISAERNKDYSVAKAAGLTANGHKSNGGSPDNARFIHDGHIYSNDSLKITRTNDEDGKTGIYADYHIRTAMVNILDSSAMNKNNTAIESHLGDIWLGYSVSPYPCPTPGQTTLGYDINRFIYKNLGSTNNQSLLIRAGYQDQSNTTRYGGGNIYVAQMKNELTTGGTTDTEISIPFSNEYLCGSTWSPDFLYNRKDSSMMMYEHAGIIFGLGRCGEDKNIDKYAPAQNLASGNKVTKTSLIYRGNKGNLKVDAGTRGNIILNKGGLINFQDPQNTGNVTFRTRFGDIDMRDPFNADSIAGSLLFLAQTENLSDLSKVGYCGCEEERNNVYLQDFQYKAHGASGSIFVGADNNIKLNYGGLQNKGTRYDPFLSTDYLACPDSSVAKIGSGYQRGGGCGPMYHCDMHDSVNQARNLILNFYQDSTNTDITSGGFAAVASDYIDVYKSLIYKGGNGSGMSAVPGAGTLHGESVAGYGLYMKTQANKNNWNTNIFKNYPKCPMGCSGFECNGGFLHMISRMTFHADARIYAHNQRVYLGSPVIESFGPMVLNTDSMSGGRTEIVIQTDSLILHDSLVVKGKKLRYRSWSGLKNDRPIIKFGYMRRTPPFTEYTKNVCGADLDVCEPCHDYIRGSKDPVHMLDTITIKFEEGAYLERLNSVVFDHTVLTFLTDSFDHVQGPPVEHARIYVDTLRVRNQVDLYADAKHERDAHFELISEEQMSSKKYAGVYTRHYHMEPVGACGRNYSELWLSDDLALDVITTSTFGGFGYQHSDVHVENMAHLNPGFTSLRLRGQCYEQKCGTLKMKDLRLDGGAQLHFSVGTTEGINKEYSDAINVERLTTYGTIDVNIEIRPCERMQNRCYPIIYYQSVTPGSLNNLKLVPSSIKIDGEIVPLALDVSQEGVVYLCVGNAVLPKINYSVTIPSVTGVTTTPPAGIAYTPARSNFEFKAKYSFEKPFVVRTDRKIDGKTEEILEGKKNANGEYEYVIPQVTQHIVLKFGPDHVANMSIEGTAVWSHGETIYIRVERKDIASIYSVAGQLVRRIELSEGDTSVPMQRGVYVVTLKDGTVHKVIVK